MSDVGVWGVESAQKTFVCDFPFLPEWLGLRYSWTSGGWLGGRRAVHRQCQSHGQSDNTCHHQLEKFAGRVKNQGAGAARCCCCSLAGFAAACRAGLLGLALPRWGEQKARAAGVEGGRAGGCKRPIHC